MYYLGIISFVATMWFSFHAGEMSGRNAEQIEQRRRREWQHRLDRERNK